MGWLGPSAAGASASAIVSASGVVSVKASGAKGVGTDDTAALQAALDSGKLAGLIPGETYGITAPLTITASNRGFWSQMTRSESDASIPIIEALDGFSGDAMLLVNDGGATTLGGVDLYGFKLDGNGIAPVGLKATRVSNAVLEHLHVTGCRWGYWLDGLWLAQIRGCMARLNGSAKSTGTAQAGGASTIRPAEGTTDVVKGDVFVLTGGTGAGQRRLVTAWDETDATVSPAWDTQPDATTTYDLCRGGGILCDVAVREWANGSIYSSYANRNYNWQMLCAGETTTKRFNSMKLFGCLFESPEDDNDSQALVEMWGADKTAFYGCEFNMPTGETPACVKLAPQASAVIRWLDFDRSYFQHNVSGPGFAFRTSGTTANIQSVSFTYPRYVGSNSKIMNGNDFSAGVVTMQHDASFDFHTFVSNIGNIVKVPRLVAVPSTTTSPGAKGDYAIDASYIYTCHGLNAWRRAALSTW